MVGVKVGRGDVMREADLAVWYAPRVSRGSAMEPAPEANEPAPEQRE